MNDENRIKKNLHNNAEWLWLRCAGSDIRDIVACVLVGGDVFYDHYYFESGVVPFFMI